LKAKFSFKEGDLKPGEQPLSDDVKNLIKSILEPNPDKRITMQGILNHRWMQDE
jgi:serine/threonine protein kinase